MIIYTNEVVVLSWLPEIKAINTEWKGFATAELFREPLLKGLNFLKEHQGCNWLADQRKLSLLDREDLHWVVDTWLPMASKVNLKNFAGVFSSKKATQIFMEDLSQIVARSFHINFGFFSTKEEAIDWLKKQLS